MAQITVQQKFISISVESQKLKIKIPFKEKSKNERASHSFYNCQSRLVDPFAVPDCQSCSVKAKNKIKGNKSLMAEVLEVQANSFGYTFIKRKSDRKKLTLINPFVVSKFSWGQLYEWKSLDSQPKQYNLICLKTMSYCQLIGPYIKKTLDWKNLKIKPIF